MKVSDILTYTKKLLGFENDIDPHYSSGDATLKNRSMLTAFNMAISQIGTDYFPFITTEEKKGEVIYYSLFQKPVYDIVKVEEQGQQVAFIKFDDKIEMPQKGTYQITYRYVFPLLTEKDTIELDPKLTLRTLALATAATYAELNGLFEESITYFKQFEKSIELAAGKIRNFTMKVKERWLG